jgi:hypothetical protein
MKLTILALCVLGSHALSALRRQEARQEPGANTQNAVSKVVKLLREMKATAEAEAKEDEEIYGKMDCWCITNEKEKTEAIEVAKKRIEDLTSAIETGNARAAQLATEIDGLKDEMQADQDALDQATAIREKEKEDFEAEDADLSESIGLLKEAIAVLAKVQLMQKQAQAPSSQPTLAEAANAEALVQVRDLVKRAMKPKGSGGVYFNVMQKDLWDLFGSMPAASPRVITGLSQEAQPTGAAAGATSYSAKSSSIFGILEEMQSQMERDLSAAHKAEITAEIGFQRLRAAKESEIAEAAKSIEEKTAEKAETEQKVAQAKEDLEDTTEALAADQKFLVDLQARCKTAAKDFAQRSATRQDEITAIGEAIVVLTNDDARDVFAKTVSFLQMGSSKHHQAGAAASTHLSTRQHIASQLLQFAKRHSGTEGGWRLALLAVSAQLDGFEKVKEMMDKMIVELKKQQKAEYEKHESCKKDIDANEDSTMEKEAEHKDLAAKKVSLEGQLEQLTNELAELATQVQQAHVALKQAGETRKKENHEFQQVVADQRATIQILNKALDRLKSFYNRESLLSVGANAKKQEPGAPVAPPPAAGKKYEESGMSGGVMQLLEKIIQDAEIADKEAVTAEQNSQEAYAEFVANTNAMLDDYQKSIASKTEAKDKATSDLLVTKQDITAVETTLQDLADINKALHLNCDYLLKNYNIRQTARDEEIEAIQEAKASAGLYFDSQVCSTARHIMAGLLKHHLPARSFSESSLEYVVLDSNRSWCRNEVEEKSSCFGPVASPRQDN